MKRIFAMTGLLVFAHASAAFGQSAIGTNYQADQSGSGYLRLGLGTGRSDFSLAGGSSPGYWGFGMDAAAGVTFSDRVRWDVIEIGYNSFDESLLVLGTPFQLDGSRLDLQTNVWIGDFDRARRFHPYVGAGVGSARFTVNGDGEWGFAWNAGAGFEFQLTPTLAVGPRYVFRQALFFDVFPSTGSVVDMDLNTHEFTVSIVWSN